MSLHFHAVKCPLVQDAKQHRVCRDLFLCRPRKLSSCGPLALRGSLSSCTATRAGSWLIFNRKHVIDVITVLCYSPDNCGLNKFFSTTVFPIRKEKDAD